MRRTLSSAILTALLAVGIATAPSAVAAPSVDVHDQLRSFFSTNGVASQTQDLLLEKFDAGVAWDSSTGVAPVSTATTTSAGWLTSTDTYADGSITVTKLQTGSTGSEGSISPRAVGSCSTATSGLTRTLTNCVVSVQSGLIGIQFSANYRYTYGSATDIWVSAASIQKAWNPVAQVIGGSFGDLSVSVTKTTAASGNPATARASMTVTGIGGWAGSTAWLQLNVPIGGYTLAYSTSFI